MYLFSKEGFVHEVNESISDLQKKNVLTIYCNTDYLITVKGITCLKRLCIFIFSCFLYDK